jgi:hypothetical protein
MSGYLASYFEEFLFTAAPQFHQMVFPWNTQSVKDCQDKEFWPLQKLLCH